MREDQDINLCPETLGEYYDLFSSFYGVDCAACKFLKVKIDSQGRDENVIAHYNQMMMLLMELNKSGVVS